VRPAILAESAARGCLLFFDFKTNKKRRKTKKNSTHFSSKNQKILEKLLENISTLGRKIKKTIVKSTELVLSEATPLLRSTYGVP
jgi:hypothetical protein